MVLWNSISLQAISLLNVALLASRRRNNDVFDMGSYFDEYGGLGSVNNAYRAIDQATSYVIVRCANCTLIGVAEPNEIPFVVKRSGECLNKIMDKHLSILLTGVIGDCRDVIEHTRIACLNYTMDFDAYPTGEFIANSLAKYLHHLTMNVRPLGVHSFIIDSHRGTLHEVSSGGKIHEAVGGVGGLRMHENYKTLNGLYRSRMNISEAENIVETILNMTAEYELQNGRVWNRQIKLFTIQDDETQTPVSMATMFDGIL